MNGRTIAGALLAAATPGACGPGARSQEAGTPPDARPEVSRPVGPTLMPTPAPAPACSDEPGMVHIPGGDYKFWQDKEQRPVAAFWIDRTEVAVQAFRAFVAAGHSPPYGSDTKALPLVCTWELSDNDQLPINCIDWYQAEAFCLWSKKRLPTAQEWGWAAQGREELRKYPWGSERPSCDFAIIDQNRDDDITGCGRARPWPVGSRPRDVTRDGVLDMMGNVSELTSTGATAEERSSRVALGATWSTQASERFDVTGRGAYAGREAYSDKTGVRCAKDLGPKPPCTPAAAPGVPNQP